MKAQSRTGAWHWGLLAVILAIGLALRGLRPIAEAVGRSMKPVTPKPPSGGPLAGSFVP